MSRAGVKDRCGQGGRWAVVAASALSGSAFSGVVFAAEQASIGKSQPAVEIAESRVFVPPDPESVVFVPLRIASDPVGGGGPISISELPQSVVVRFERSGKSPGEPAAGSVSAAQVEAFEIPTALILVRAEYALDAERQLGEGEPAEAGEINARSRSREAAARWLGPRESWTVLRPPFADPDAASPAYSWLLCAVVPSAAARDAAFLAVGGSRAAIVEPGIDACAPLAVDAKMRAMCVGADQASGSGTSVSPDLDFLHACLAHTEESPATRWRARLARERLGLTPARGAPQGGPVDAAASGPGARAGGPDRASALTPELAAFADHMELTWRCSLHALEGVDPGLYERVADAVLGAVVAEGTVVPLWWDATEEIGPALFAMLDAGWERGGERDRLENAMRAIPDALMWVSDPAAPAAAWVYSPDERAQASIGVAVSVIHFSRGPLAAWTVPSGVDPRGVARHVPTIPRSGDSVQPQRIAVAADPGIAFPGEHPQERESGADGVVAVGPNAATLVAVPPRRIVTLACPVVPREAGQRSDARSNANESSATLVWIGDMAGELMESDRVGGGGWGGAGVGGTVWGVRELSGAGVALAPFFPDRTAEELLRCVQVQPEQEASIAAFLYRSGSASGSGIGRSGGEGSSTADAAAAPPSCGVELFIECVSRPTSKPSDASEEVVDVFFGPRDAPRVIVRVFSTGIAQNRLTGEKFNVRVAHSGSAEMSSGREGGNETPGSERSARAKWSAWLPVPLAAMESGSILRMGIERFDAAGGRVSWPAPSCPWEDAPPRAAFVLESD